MSFITVLSLSCDQTYVHGLILLIALLPLATPHVTAVDCISVGVEPVISSKETVGFTACHDMRAMVLHITVIGISISHPASAEVARDDPFVTVSPLSVRM